MNTAYRVIVVVTLCVAKQAQLFTQRSVFTAGRRCRQIKKLALK